MFSHVKQQLKCSSRKQVDEDDEQSSEQLASSIKQQDGGQEVPGQGRAIEEQHIKGKHEQKKTEQQFFMADELTWTTRLTIILIGASILFSLFFGLEFLVGKLVASLSSSSGGIIATSGCLVVDALQHSQFNRHFGQLGPAPINATNATTGNYRAQSSKLGVNFELIFERELELNEARTHYKLPETGPQDRQRDREELLVKPELKLQQLLAAYQKAMPFNPDIWILSEPQEQARELMSGNLFECRRQLIEMVNEIEQALSAAGATSGPERQHSGPLARIGHRHYQAMKLLDSQGRPEAGTLMGHPFWLGSYLECERLNARDANSIADETQSGGTSSSSIGPTRYCVGKLAFKSWLLDEEGSAQLEPPARPQQQSIKVGLCLPRQCDSLQLFRHHAPGAQSESTNDTIEAVRGLAERIVGYNLNERIYPKEQMHLLDIFCLPARERRQLGAVAYLLLLFLFGWFGLLCVCTSARRNPQKSVLVGRILGRKLIDCLSVDVNFDLFLSARQQPSSVHPKDRAQEEARLKTNLSVLDSVKHLGCAGVILAHVLLAYLTLGTSYNHTIETIGRDMRTMLLLSLNNIVDTFFVISGLLVAYLTFKKLAQKETNAKRAQCKDHHHHHHHHHVESERIHSRWSIAFVWLRRYLDIVAGRYLRMAPLYFLVYAFAKTISVHLGEGPLWDYATNAQSLRGMCKRESWFWPLVFASDLKPITQHCVPPAWSISVDMQFFLVASPFVRLLQSLSTSRVGRRWRPFSYSLLGFLAVLSTALTLADYKSLLDYVSLRDFARLRLHVFTVLIRHAAHAYSQPQNRMGPLLIGLVGGHLLFEYENQEQAQELSQSKEGPSRPESGARKWPFWMRGSYFKATLLACACSMLAPCLVQLRDRARDWVALDWAPNQEETTTTGLGLVKLVVELLLALKTSTRFDCYLALVGFVFIKLLWSACNCIVFLRLVTDLSGTLCARLMSLPIWQILCKLNYAILLVHFELIAYEAMSRLAQDQPITWTCLMTKFAFAYLFSLLLACPLYVCFELPIQRLIASSRLLEFAPEPKTPEKEGGDPLPLGAGKLEEPNAQEDQAQDLRQRLVDTQAEKRRRKLGAS